MKYKCFIMCILFTTVFNCSVWNGCSFLWSWSKQQQKPMSWSLLTKWGPSIGVCCQFRPNAHNRINDLFCANENAGRKWRTNPSIGDLWRWCRGHILLFLFVAFINHSYYIFHRICFAKILKNTSFFEFSFYLKIKTIS